MPLEAVKEILFSKPLVKLGDAFGDLSPLYCEGDTDWDENETEMILLWDKQEQSFENKVKR